MKTTSTQTPLVRLIFALLFMISGFDGIRADAQCNYFTKLATSSGSVHTLGIKNDSTLWAWGSNQSGELGDGTTTESLVPKRIGTGSNWVDIASGTSFSIGITADGKLWGWGDDQLGQYGIDTVLSSPMPVQIGTATNWVSVAACNSHSFAISADGRLWATGYGFLGLGNSNTSNVFVPVNGDKDWATVSTGNLQTVVLKKDGTLWAWGRDAEGEAGDGDPAGPNVYSPEKIGTAANWVKISCGWDHTLAITADGKLWAWGQNNEGEVGDGTTTNATHGPQQIGTATNWVAIAGGYTHSLGVTADGKLWAWGQNNIGELGDGTVTSILLPEQIAIITNWQSIVAGEEYSLGMTSEGIGWGWGRNVEGELGDGSLVNKYSPTNIGAPDYTGLAASGSSNTLYQGNLSIYSTDCANLIATVAQTGGAPVSGPTTAKVWVDASVLADGSNKPYLQRHYQITPASNAGTATATVTLYYTQAEFTAYNAYASVVDGTYPKLPVDAADAQGYKTNLSFTKISGVSGDGGGAPGSYSGTRTSIIPTAVAYQNGWWAVTLPVAGFSGFFAGTGGGVLPVTWVKVSGDLDVRGYATINWQVQEQNVVSYTIEKSIDGKDFVPLGSIAGKGDGLNSYRFTEDGALTGAASYRIQQTDKDGKSSYSFVVLLNGAAVASKMSLFPNPGGDHLFINGLSVNERYTITVTDMLGKAILTTAINGGQNELFLSEVAKGVYLIHVTGNGVATTLKFMKR